MVYFVELNILECEGVFELKKLAVICAFTILILAGCGLGDSDNNGEYSQLNTRQCYVAQDIATTSSQVKRHSTQQTQAVDSTRELNSYYVGQVQSSDLPQQSSSDMLPNTGMKDKNFNTNGIISLFLLTAGFITLYHQPLRKMS